MVKPLILDPATSYSFSQYGALPFDTADVLAEFGVTFQSTSLQLPEKHPLDPTPLTRELEENLALVDPTSEIARRESLIFPVLKTVCKFIRSPLKIEYSIRVSNQLKGNVDYFIPTPHNLVIIEAKNGDLGKGFTQLAVELIALDRWIDAPVDCLYGAVTTGDTWKFGLFHRHQKSIQKDINIYGVPNDLAKVLAILFGITLSTTTNALANSAVESILPNGIQQPKTFLKTARSLKLHGDPDWSEKIDQYLYGETLSKND